MRVRGEISSLVRPLALRTPLTMKLSRQASTNLSSPTGVCMHYAVQHPLENASPLQGVATHSALSIPAAPISPSHGRHQDAVTDVTTECCKNQAPQIQCVVLSYQLVPARIGTAFWIPRMTTMTPLSSIPHVSATLSGACCPPHVASGLPAGQIAKPHLPTNTATCCKRLQEVSSWE